MPARSSCAPTRPTSPQLAETVAAEFVPALGAHESELELQLGDEPSSPSCDRERVAQVVRILLDNALAHTPAGTDLLLAAGRANGRVRLAVTDAGPGSRAPTCGASSSRSTPPTGAAGSGLGLAIARELAERMGGELAADSIPGRTTFTLAIPG